MQHPGISSGVSAAGNDVCQKLQELLAIGHGALKAKVYQGRRWDKRDNEVLDVYGDRLIPAWMFVQTIFHSGNLRFPH